MIQRKFSYRSFRIKWLWIAAILVALPVLAAKSQERNLLTGKYSFEDVRMNIIPQNRWKPFPKDADRQAWNALPDNVRNHYINKGRDAQSYNWAPLPASVFREFVIKGNRSHYEALFFERREKLADLVLAELMEGKNRFVDDIMNGVWAICEESYWGVPAHLYLQKEGRGLPDITEPTVDLFAAETGALLAWTDYLVGDKLDSISPLIRQRIYHEADRRIITPCFERNDFWWMGFVTLEEAGIHIERLNNWAPWIDSNWLTALLLLEKNEERRVQSVYKIMRCIDHYLNPHPADGGCDEGPSYWNRAGGSLFDCLDLLFSASGGEINIFDQPLVAEMGRYIYRAHINDNYYINFADASAVIRINPGLVFRYGQRIGDETMMEFASSAAIRQDYGNPEVNGNLGRKISGLFILDQLRSAPSLHSGVKDAWFPNLQVMAARSSNRNGKDYYVAAKGGHNHESHNHNDVGNFIVYIDGLPVIIDVGVETYSAKTFDPEHRYEIWTMQSAYHNLPTINGVMEMNGLEYRAGNVKYHAGQKRAELTLDIAHAYPQEAKLESYMRSVVLNREKNVEITDHYILKEMKEPLLLNLMTPMLVDVSTAGKISLTGKDNEQDPFFVLYDKGKLEATAEIIPLEDRRLQNVWGGELTRIVLRVRSDALEDEIKLSIR